MKHYLIDTNIALDLLMDREGFADAAENVFNVAEKGECQLYLCSLSYTNIYYVMRPHFGKTDTIEGLKKLSQLVTTLPVDNDIIQSALNSCFNDFEDAVQYYSAKSHPVIDGIVTRNTKDFKQSDIQVINPLKNII